MPLARDGCVVPTEQLTDLLSGFVQSWQRERPSRRGQFRSGSPADHSGDLLTAVEFLSEQTRRVDPAGIGLPVEMIQNLVEHPRRSRHTELRIADPLVAAMGRTDVYHSEPPALEVLPNPRVARENRGSCCAGSIPRFEPWSLTGS